MIKTPNLNVLEMIISRLGSNNTKDGAYFDAYEIKQWSVSDLELVKKNALIEELSPLKKVVDCVACEKVCSSMKVTIDKSIDNNIFAYITCTDSGGGRIELDLEDLKVWHSSIENFRAILPHLIHTMAVPSSDIRIDEQWPLGVIRGKDAYVPIALKKQQGYGLVLLVGDQLSPLSELLTFDKNRLSIDNALIRSFAHGSKIKESADDRAIRIGKRKEELDKQKTKKARDIIAREEGVDPSMIQKILSRYKDLTSRTNTENIKKVTSVFGFGNK